jgi:hypothetical protein
MRSRRQAFPDLRRILMQNENRKKISNQHAYEDKADAAKSEQPPRAQRRKYSRLHLGKSLQCSCFLRCAHGIARTLPGFPQFSGMFSVPMPNAAASPARDGGSSFAKRRHHAFRKDLLCLDRFPVFQPAEIRNDGQLANSALVL